MAITIIDTPRKVRQFLTYDFEWVPGSMKIRICGVYDHEEGYRCYLSVDSFLDNELTAKNRGKWFYAHAGGLADIQFVFDKLVSNPEYTVRASTSGSSVIIVHVRHGKNSWHFVDSYWLLRAPLAKIATWIGRKKGSTVEGFENFTKEEKREYYEKIPIEELRDYNEEDCEILHKAIDNFQGAILELGGQLQMTQASCAMQLFRRRFLQQDIPTSRQINEIAKLSYIASRVEVFEKECEEAYYYDINSSFPHSMTKPCPGLLRKWSRRIPDDDTIYLAHARIAIPDCYMPPIPIRRNERIFFPVGRWEGWFTSVDLQLLLMEGGRVEKLYKVIEFEEFTDLKWYVEEIYKIKKAADARGDSFEREVAKLLLNSLYGKFAESPEKQMIHINPPPEYFEGLNPRLERGEYLMPGVYVESKLTMVPHAHVAISSHITALSRKSIYDYMATCLPDTVHYCDTDGFSTGARNVACGAEIGELKLERVKEPIEPWQFIAPKLYRMGNKIKAKGFSLSRDAEEAIRQFDSLRRGEKVYIERMSRVRELYRKGVSFPQEMVVPKQLRTEKVIEKRFYYPDGTSRPWSIGELERLL